uniref:Adenine deaminase n=1 Tax=uncultured marine thaumarchaeote SAT1000_23_E11 TaxID=1456396 RepID=A0A075I865_9ARCH|nr:adenine deaminase (ade) [uncultured marine thaumarchaeote SAT1000_23_E11]
MFIVFLGLSASIHTLNAVAIGDKAADLVLENCSLVNVYTGEILPETQVAISKDRIAYVGEDASHTKGKKTVVINLEKKFITPGFADSHIHIDQFVSPAEFVKKSLLCGVTSLFADSVDIVSTCGFTGFKEFMKMTSGLPARFFHVVPGGTPVDRKFSHVKSLSPTEEKSALRMPGVLGLGEVFSWTKVTKRDSKTMKTLSTMLENNCVINGHTAGMSGKKLNAYVSSGILSCHEPINFEQVIERLRLGMWIMIREGSIRRDIKDIIPLVLANKTNKDRLMFCSDGLDPIDITKFGHIDHCIREAVKLGLNLTDAISMASKNCFDYYNMGMDLGGIAPGKLADILVFDDLMKLKPKKIFVGGMLVLSNGTIVSKIKKHPVPKWMTKTVKLNKFTEDNFSIKSHSDLVDVNVIDMKTEIITKKGRETLSVKDENVIPSYDKDVWKVAAFDRTFGSTKHAVGFLKNFGPRIGAFASTWSFHENNMIVIGSNEKDMAIAANSLLRTQGGMVVVYKGKILSSMPLQMAGIMSTDSFEKTSKNFSDINNMLLDSGCKFKKPHLIPLFLPFLALPEIRILHQGIIDVKSRSFLKTIV